MDFKEIIYEKQENVAIITLNRPHALNAFTPTMQKEWIAALDDAQRDRGIRAIVVTGAGRGFCTGIDVKSLQNEKGSTLAIDRVRLARHTVQELPRMVETLDKPYIAAINGPCVGAGFDIASMADFRIASQTATFAINHLRLGLMSADGGYWFLMRIIGLPKTLDLVLTRRFFDTAEALQLGYLNKVVPPEQLMTATLALAKEIAEAPPVATQFAKRAIYRAQSLSLDEHLEDVEWMMSLLLQTEDHREGIKALLEKRPANFKGN
ncbi:MAG: enoyl-CoA hydratase/isomerase family protein [Chloroflexi bacterium]|nr:enoyl-CoA hydratase/isomerase family protein [Chloroflexota bacterium]